MSSESSDHVDLTHPSHPSNASPIVLDGLESLRGMLGVEFASADWLPIEQARIQTFAEVTDDLQWIHVDPDRARRESPYQATVAHGFLTLSLLSQFMSRAVEIRTEKIFVVNYGLDKVRFPAPVRAGGLVRARFMLRDLTEIPGGCHAIYSATVDIKDEKKPCCAAEWILRYYHSI